MPNYGDPSYWDTRYNDNSGEMFDWLEDWSTLKSVIEQYMKKDDKIIVLGCGNAEMSENMYDDGYQNIVNIDISSVVIEQMSQRNKERSKMIYEVMDVTDLEYDNGSFDVAIDKSTIDALLCGDDSYIMVAKMLKEVQRVLKPGGVYIAISYGRPGDRIHHIERPHLDFKTKVFVLYPAKAETEQEIEEKSHYIYVCWKQEDADRVCSENFEKVLAMIRAEQDEEARKYVENEEEQEKLKVNRNGQRQRSYSQQYRNDADGLY